MVPYFFRHFSYILKGATLAPMTTATTIKATVVSLFFSLLAACAPTSHPVSPAQLGQVARTQTLEASLAKPGPIQLQTVVAADWKVPRSGVLNLKNPKAKEAGLKDELEPVVIVFYALKHPTHGLYMIDSGIEKALQEHRSDAAIHGLVGLVANIGELKVHQNTADWIKSQNEPVNGVFLTHLHLDHIAGLRDVSSRTPIFVGTGETHEKAFLNYFVQDVVDAALEGKGALQQWRFAPDPDGVFEGVIDVFGDQSLWALHVPGHTHGSTAFLARTPQGPVMMVGDACHTLWGWDNEVEPGDFSSDKSHGAQSLSRLKRFAEKHPEITVKLGHQIRQ